MPASRAGTSKTMNRRFGRSDGAGIRTRMTARVAVVFWRKCDMNESMKGNRDAWEEGSVPGTPLTKKLAKATASPARKSDSSLRVALSFRSGQSLLRADDEQPRDLRAGLLPLRVVRRAAEVNGHARLVTHCPGIVSGGDVSGIAGADLTLCPVLHHDLHPAR
jgi:hypothetical protein